MKYEVTREDARNMACERNAHMQFDALESIGIDESFEMTFYAEIYSDASITLTIVFKDTKHDAKYKVSFTEYESSLAYIEAETIQRHIQLDWSSVDDFINLFYSVVGRYLLRK